MAVKFRGQTTWDPTLIIFQILTVQLFSYASLTLQMFLASELSGYSPSIVFMFDHRTLRVTSAKLIILAHFTNALVSAHLIKNFVGRSKSCLDFSATYFAIHFMVVWYYSRSIPDSFIWYFVQLVTSTIMCVTSEILCRREEMKSIPITSCV